MDVPILTAVISVSGTLLGTIVGGCLAMYGNFFLNKRRERAEFKIGCRVIAWELEEIRVIMGILRNTKHWSPADLVLTTDTWEKHQHVLASYLSDEAWRDVWKTVRSARFCRIMSAHARAAGPDDEMSDGEAKAVAGLLADIVKAQISLHPYLRKPRRRLLKPLRVWPRITRPPISG